jgi:hypothetical protein
MSEYRELLLGCGRSRDKRLDPGGTIRPWQALTTLDINPDCEPDIVHDLAGSTALEDVFERATFDEVHAYEVLEHLGSQGNVTEFFWHFFQIWLILKPGGFLCGTSPSRFSEWLWGDPGHTRVILPTSLKFLSQPFYAQCDGPHPTMASDYRSVWRGDFDILRSSDDYTLHRFILQAVKPMRKPPYG